MNLPATLQLACAAILLAVPSPARAQAVAVYGAESVGGLGSELTIYNQAGVASYIAPFQTGVGQSNWNPSTTIEDIAYDAYGRLYALGKPAGSSLRTVFKSALEPNEMNILFQAGTYDAAVEGSIAISPTGDIAVYGAQNVGGVGSNLTVYNQNGVAVDSKLFQTGVGTFAWGLSSSIQDIAYDAAGNLYAVGKPSASTKRSVFKGLPGGQMDVLFETTTTWGSTVDGSISITPAGDIGVYGASTSSVSLRVFNQAGTMLTERLFKIDELGSGWAVSSTIEDIACDGAGVFYAVGKAGGDSKRTIYKAGAPILMDPLFKNSSYNATVDGSIAVAPFTAWTTSGAGIPGSAGFPELEGLGSMAAGSSNQVRLSHAKPSSPATLIVGFNQVSLPFKGGTLYPNVNLVVPLVTNASGSVSLPFVMPAGFPSIASLYLQCWQQDAAAIQGYAATNGLTGDAP